MGQEKHRSKGGVGGFLQLFDWNGKSRKKLTYNKLDFPGIFSCPIIINRCPLVCILSSHGLFCFTASLILEACSCRGHQARKEKQ